ncbi:histidine phosphatase family protein [Rouxiella sp. Mn2063]|uniref:histidine phosphatase family protein n=1 Tax=Rouxiella sp. Mn2063 TaxID=3395262 RepID=UPI003BCBCD58
MKLYLIRHGQTQADVNGVICGSSDIGLTELGKQQAKHLANMLASVRLDGIIHSGMLRSEQTANIILGQRDINLETQTLAQEICFGQWELRCHSEVKSSATVSYADWCRDWQLAEVPGGELFADFSQRIRRALNQLYLRPANSQLAIIGEQGALSFMLAMMLKLAPADMLRFPFHQGSLCEVELTNGYCVIQRFNDTGLLAMPEASSLGSSTNQCLAEP